MAKVIELKNVRLSFPHVFEHGTFGGESTGKYEATFLLPKSDEKTYKAIMAEVEATKGKTKIPSDKICVKDGDELDDEYTDGHWVIRTANPNRPTLVNRKGIPVTKDDNEVDPMFFGGATVNAFISFWKQDNAYGKRVNGNLAGIQYVSGDQMEDGFGDTGTVKTDMFSVLDDEEDSDDEY
jgi:hypothetical protein